MLNEEQARVFGEIKDWLDDPGKKVFALSGAFSTGKRRILSIAKDEFSKRNKRILLLAPNACIAHRYTVFCDESRDSRSIYSWLYTKEPEIKSGKRLYRIKQDEDTPDKDLIIIVESHLLGNSRFETGTRIYGSGYILNDFIESFNDKQGSRGFQRLPKILLIGDPYQITVGEKERSLLQCQIFKEQNIDCILTELHTQVKGDSADVECLAFQLDLIEKIRSRIFVQLPICQQGTIQTIRKGKYVDRIAESLDQWPRITYLLRSTNIEAQSANRSFRKKYFKADRFNKLVPGDIVDVRNPVLDLSTFRPQIYRGTEQQSCLIRESKRIHHCNFARVISSGEIYEESIRLRGRNTPISVKLANAEIEFAYGTTAAILYLPDFLSSPRPELMQDQAVALWVLARREADNILTEQKSELDLIKQKLDEMGTDPEVRKHLAALQRLKGDKRKRKTKSEHTRTEEEIAEHEKALRPYRKQQELYKQKKLCYRKMHDALIKESRYMNAARLRYAYSLTVHRAQRLKPFPRVLLDGKSAPNTDNPATDSYFRFLYTATTCTSRELQIVNYPKLTPLSKTRWVFENVRTLPITFKLRLHYQQDRIPDESVPLPDGFNSSEPKLMALLLTVQELTSDIGTGWCIESIRPLQYMERYSLSSTKGKVTVDFSYNNKYEVSISRVRVKDGPPELEREIRQLLVTPVIFKEKRIADAVEILKHHFSKRDWTILSADEHKYRVYLIVEHDAGKIKLEVDVPTDASSSKKGVISRIQVAQADSVETLDQFKIDFSYG
ncbi:MAG: hypothetical protein F4X05_03240 [Rhodothermaceae bacterium]|nr:hypothetical protein [Rhodothermaceae bacterium]MYD18643.1 hypothetical protein [Rhodothermaceae bacterium]MYI44527.1 hypothetical protein [Rhodothermaceae bacterium]